MGRTRLSARARDAAGNQATSTVVNVTVSNGATGLVGAWGFEENSGTSTADSSGNAFSGTLSNATWTTSGKFGNALSFNGTNAWVTVADTNALDLAGAMTLEAWLRPSTLSGWRTALLRGFGAFAYALYAHDNSPRPASYVRIGSNDQEAFGTAQLPLNAWSHVAATYDGANLHLYVNATQVGTLAVTGSMSATTGALRTGGNSLWGEILSGLIDEVRVYTQALGAAEIQTDMNTPVTAPDTTPPTVSMAPPANNATVSGTVTVSANASDNIGVAGVPIQARRGEFRR